MIRSAEAACDTDSVVVALDGTRPRRPRVRSDAGRVLAVFLAFAAGAVLSWESFGSWGGPSFFYPGAGVTVAAMKLSRRSLWPWIAAAVVAAEILVDTVYGSPLGASAGFAAANVVEPFVGASVVLECCGGRPDLRKRRDFFTFIAGACLVGPFFGALIGGSISSRHDGTPWLSAAATWWTGDALGVLVMASPILLWGLQVSVLRRRPWETAAVLVVTGLLSVATFWTDFPPTILILPVLAWAAFRLDMLGAAIAGAVAAFLANIMSTHGAGMFAHTDMTQGSRVTLTQIYVAVIVVVAMLIAQEAADRLHAVREKETERRERVRLETLSRLALQLAAALTPQDIGRALTDQVLNEAGARALVLGLLSADGARLEWVTTSGYPEAMLDELGTGMPMSQRATMTDAVRFGESVEMRTAEQYIDAYPGMASLMGLFGAESVVALPLRAGGDPFGALLLVWSEPQPIDEAQRAYVTAASTMVSQALVRARIYADEHARAAVLHSVAQPVARAKAVGLEYRALYRPADASHGLGGDWYSVMALPDRRTYLTVGDVIGHGLMSVEDMAQLRSAGNAYAHQGLPPSRVLSDLNGFAANQMQGEFATALVAIYNPDEGLVSYSAAGHLPALIRRADTGEVERLSGASGPMLGPFSDSEYTDAAVPVRPGDILVMYTDGLVEHLGERLDAGIEHLAQVVAQWPPDAWVDCESLAEAVAPAPHDDDLCLLIVRFGNDDTRP